MNISNKVPITISQLVEQEDSLKRDAREPAGYTAGTLASTQRGSVIVYYIFLPRSPLVKIRKEDS